MNKFGLGDETTVSLYNTTSLFQVANLTGETLKEVIGKNHQGGDVADPSFDATIIMGGQIAGEPQRLFSLISRGNFIEASDDTQFFNRVRLSMDDQSWYARLTRQ